MVGLVAGLSPLISPMKAADAPTPIPTEASRVSKRVSKRCELNYLITLPEGYAKSGRKNWPLLVFLHGAGERGSRLESLKMHGPPKLARQGRALPFIVVSPQCPSNEVWDDDAVLALIDSVIAKQRVDTKRVYLTGLSMGGYGTWSLAATHPERFAAVAPICGGGNLISLLLADKGQKVALKSLGVWAFHGGKDSVVPVGESERMVQALKRLGHPDPKLTIYPNADHDSWTETYNNPELYAWFLKHSR